MSNPATNSLVEERLALESIALDPKLSIDSRIDALCKKYQLSECRIEDVLVILSAMRDSEECNASSLISSLKHLLLDGATKCSDKSLILSHLLQTANSLECSNNPLLHPVISCMVADHSLIPILTSFLTADISSPYSCKTMVVEFIFSSEADSLFPEPLIAWTRSVFSHAYQSIAKSYLKNHSDSLSFYTAQALSHLIDDPCPIMLRLSLNQQPLISSDKIIEAPSYHLMALIIRISFYGSVDDALGLASRLAKPTATSEFVLFFSAIIMSVRHPNDPRPTSIISKYQSSGPGVDIARLSREMSRLLASDKDMTHLVGLMAALAGNTFEELSLSSLTSPSLVTSLLVEIGIRCLMYSVGRNRNSAQCLRQMVQYTFIHQTIAETVVSILEEVMEKHPELSSAIMSALASNSRSLPILKFLVARMEKAYVTDVEQFFRLATYLLDEPNVRQSTLDLIASRLKMDSASYSSPSLISGCMDLWTRLVQLRYISPECIFTEIALRNNWPQSNDPLITISFISFCSTFSLLPLVEVEQVKSLNATAADALGLILSHLSYEHKYLEGIGALKSSSNVNKGKKKSVIEAVFACISKFDQAVMLSFMKEQKGIQFASLMQVLAKYECYNTTASMTAVLSWYLEREVSDMPRSLLLGAFGGRIHVPHVVGGVFSNLLTMPPIESINLANFDNFPWFMKMDLVEALSLYYQKLVVEVNLDVIVEELEAIVTRSPSKENVCLWGLSMAVIVARLATSESMVAGVKESTLKFKTMQSDDVQFAVGCLECILSTSERTSAPATLSESMAMALFGDLPSDVNSITSKRLLLPFAYASKYNAPSNTEILQSEEPEYYSYLLSLITACNLNNIPSSEDTKSIIKKSIQVSVKEPLDMQGSAAYFTAKFSRSPIDPSPSLHAMPVVRQVQYLASASVMYEGVECLDRLISLAAKSKRLLPFVDVIVYRKYHADTKKGSIDPDMEGSFERFSDGSVFKCLILNLSILSEVCLSILSATDVIPVISWEEHLRPIINHHLLGRMTFKHLYSEAGSNRRINQSLSIVVTEAFSAGNKSMLQVLPALTGELRDKCLDLIATNWTSLSVEELHLIAPFADALLIDSLLTKHFGCIEDHFSSPPTDQLLALLSALSVHPLIKNERWSRASHMLRHAQHGALSDYMNSVDCSFAALLLSHLFRKYPNNDSRKIINDSLRELVESLN